MKHLKTFENYFQSTPPFMGQEEETYSDNEMEMYPSEEEEITVPPFGQEKEGCDCGPNCECGSDKSETPMSYPRKWDNEEEEEGEEMMPSDMEIMKFEAKKTSKKSKPDFIDLDKDGDKKESMKKAASDKKKAESKKDEKESKKGSKLSKAQEKLPPALKKAIAQGVRD